ncbi:DUF6168 family protein [uncultured Polaribacter sp.]|uniref:DUF6168 family protein n=1 Tax=uncultured Polaribacter sp. TaxID=174711 RepID=UPI00261803C8|nr:DUF6168 family protein [uncultured Polaribacter sp.]
MIKRVLIIAVVFLMLGVLGYHLHHYILTKLAINPTFSLSKLYIFNTGFSLLVCSNFVLLSNVNKIAEQLGFIYLGALLLKIVLFVATFYVTVIKQNIVPLADKISMLITLFIFLSTELFFVIKLINKKQSI